MEGSYHLGDVLLVGKFNASPTRYSLLKFHHPLSETSNRNNFFIQRCVALPGDCLKISGENIIINKQMLEPIPFAKYNYFIHIDTTYDITGEFERLGVNDYISVSKNGKYGCALSNTQKDRLEKYTGVQKIEARTENENIFDPRIYPHHESFEWNTHHYGTVYVPKKNDTLLLDSLNTRLYECILVTHEKNTVEVKNDSVFVNDVYTKNYRIKQNYYFVLGDNRDNAVDSRYWGFLPESKIIGKVLLTLKKK